MRTRVGRELDLGLFSGLCLARRQCRETAGGSELCPQPEPVPRSDSVLRPARQAVAPGGFAQRSALRLERQRSRIAWSVRGYGSMANAGFLNHKLRMSTDRYGSSFGRNSEWRRGAKT